MNEVGNWGGNKKVLEIIQVSNTSYLAQGCLSALVVFTFGASDLLFMS